jgi:hypothetical protein
MRALANDGQPRFRLPCAEVLLPSCAGPLAAPRLRRQRLVLLFGAAVTGCAGPRPRPAPKTKPALTGLSSVLTTNLPSAPTWSYVADDHHFLIVQAPPAPSSLKSISTGYCLPQPLTSHLSCHCLAPVAPEKGVTTYGANVLNFGACQ